MRLLPIMLALLLVPAATAHDLGVGFDPAADAGLFPEPSEVQAAIDKAGTHPHATVHVMGQSQDGIPLRLVEYILPGIPVEERVVTFIMTQQHGNEPAGTPAALDLFDRIAAGEFDDQLANQVLLVMPQANPDGSLDERRTAEDGTDINRDHIALETLEAQALHAVLNQWNVHVAFDHHEYGGIGTGSPSPVRIYDWDITTMMPNHGNVRQPTLELAHTMNYDHIHPYVKERGYTIGDYGWQGVGVSGTPVGDVFVPLQQTAGGPDPAILRNNFGLNNVVGLLVESFVIPAETPLASFERRVGAHVAVMEAVLLFAHDEADTLIATKSESERLNLEQPMSQYVEGDSTATLARAYSVGQSLDDLMALHGLPAAHAAAGAFVYGLDNERAGLLAAMLEPTSSRNVADGVPTELPESAQLDGHEGDDHDAPSAGAILVLGVLFAALVQRRFQY